ncbi:hypothetical protein E0485_02250 [Paenibacillus albiflavus]|uniref:YvaD family protein n=1 Tax=Paenibacillus albiflavus TaxID=2545760 RepID=A0A4R4ERP7_9BACL|nr:YvaD family protein [Paenibacillus albiflavus]TCZ81118.1 hypothetical protein E0485_02250 [Paenibacillus albiflavus]
MNKLMIFFLITDIGFILYWGITILGVIPQEYLYQDYTNQLLVTWNWSFFPLDILISITGFISLYLLRKKNDRWKVAALISLILTFCSGLQAIAFWTIKLDFDIGWWLPNLYLLIYPLFFIPSIVKGSRLSKGADYCD